MLSEYDIFADVGARFTATVKEFSVTSTDSISIEVVNVRGNQGIISAVEIVQPISGGLPVATTNLEFSPDDGANWIPIAADLAMGRFGEGSFQWIAGPQTLGTTGRIRATGVLGGFPTVLKSSDEPFSIAGAGTTYYLNISNDLDLTKCVEGE